MNKRIIASIMLIIICSVGAVHSQQPATGKISRVKPQVQIKPAEAFPELDSYGALSGIKNANGENFFGKNSPMPYDGYSIAYRIGKAETQIVSAIQKNVTTDQLVPVKGDGKVPAMVRTKDGALQITSHFAVHSQSGSLVVARVIENISAQPVNLLALEVHTDARLSRDYNPEQPRLAPENIRKAIYATLTVTPRHKHCLTCEPCMGHGCDGCPPCTGLFADCIGYVEDDQGRLKPFAVGRCGTCILKPEICNTTKRRVVSHWSHGNKLPIALEPGKTILVRMGYYLR